MGLDEFMDLDTDESASDTQSNSSETNDSLTKYDNRYKDENGKVKKRGPYGYKDKDTFEKTIDGELDDSEELIKFDCPVFPHITLEDKFKRGKRYTTENTRQTLVCSSKQELKVYKINREILMLDTGETEKEQALDTLDKRFERELKPTDKVYLHFFANTRHIVKLAMGNELTDEITTYPKDAILKAVYSETYTQQFREKKTGVKDLKNVCDIKEW